MTKYLLLAAVFVLALASPRAAQQRSGPPPAGDPKIAEELIALEHRIEAATVKPDVPFLTKLMAEDFRLQHQDAWIDMDRFEAPGAMLDDKPTWLKSLRPGRFTKRILDKVKVEQHGDIAVTSGRIQTATDSGGAYTAYYMRVFARRNGQWQLLMSRTVRYRRDVVNR